MTLKNAETVDVLMLLEGTFPYVRGGVSSWVNRMIQGFPHLRFGIIFLGSARDDYRGKPYGIPENVHYFADYYLYDEASMQRSRRSSAKLGNLQPVVSAHCQMKECIAGNTAGVDLHDFARNFGVDQDQFLRSTEVWQYLLDRYREIPDQPSFVDYFWTIRGMHAPLWILQRALEQAPQARIFHCPSTGYAGYLGTLLSQQQGRPLIISEHGIYTKERRIDLMLARWIQEDKEFLQRAGRIHYLRQLWIHFFEFLGRVTYQQSWKIINLYAGVIPLQLADGADQKKLLTIPNGVRVEQFIASRRDFLQRENIVALIGRVVPIKDIKTFIRAASILQKKGRMTKFWIVGPTEEDEEYFTKCHILVTHLGLTAHVEFLGFQSVQEILGKVRLSVLSSISEGLPLSVLESFAAGVPVVATDVGSCQELVYGADTEAPVPAGKIVPIADPETLAAAIAALLDDQAAWTHCSENAIARVEEQYREEQMFGQYRELYEQMMAD